MRNFILGIIVTLLLLFLGGLAIATLGFLPTNADSTPPKMESRIAMSAVDASMERHAPRCDQSRATHRRQSDRRNENLHHELRRMSWQPR